MGLLREVAAAFPDQPRFRRDLVTALLGLAAAEQAHHKSPAVLEIFRECARILRELNAVGLLKNNPDDLTLLRTCEAGIRDLEQRPNRRP